MEIIPNFLWRLTDILPNYTASHTYSSHSRLNVYMDEERIYMLYVVFSNFFQNLTIKDKKENLVVHWNGRRGANITQNLPVSEEMYLS